MLLFKVFWRRKSAVHFQWRGELLMEGRVTSCERSPEKRQYAVTQYIPQVSSRRVVMSHAQRRDCTTTEEHSERSTNDIMLLHQQQHFARDEEAPLGSKRIHPYIRATPFLHACSVRKRP